MKPSKKTAFILSVFLATASTIAFTGCDSVENAKNEMDESISNMQDKKLTDDNGKEYTLHQNEDGTETATYDNGESVTFRKNDDWNISYVSGAAGLLGGLALSYLLFHGYSHPTGYFDRETNSYMVTSQKPERERNRMYSNASHYVPSTSKTTESAETATTATKPTNNTAMTSKGGFGGAGARSAAS